MDEDSLLVKILAGELHYAKLWLVCVALRGVSWDKMPFEQRELAFQAKDAAINCLTIFLGSQDYRAALRYAVHDGLVTAAFSGLFLLKMASLFPTELDLPGITSQVEQLAQLLSEVAAERHVHASFRTTFFLFMLMTYQICADIARHACQPPTQDGPHASGWPGRRDGAWEPAAGPALRRPARADRAAPATGSNHDGGARAALPAGCARSARSSPRRYPSVAAGAEPDGPRLARERLGRNLYGPEPWNRVARRICPHA